jgi:hypothetical protein
MKIMWSKWILIFLISLPAWGFRLTVDFANGFYWANLPINITVLDNDTSRKATLESISKKAIQEWEERSGLTLWAFKASNGTSASSNVIRWSENFAAETRMDPVSVLAVAIRHTVGPYFARTEIVINGNHYLNRDLNHLRTTLTHELGHTMGLDHSDVYRAIMAPTLQNPYHGLDRDDVEGIVHIHNESQHRQLTGYISPLAYETRTSQQPLSCASAGIITARSAGTKLQGPLTLLLGMLISFVRRLFKKFK